VLGNMFDGRFGTWGLHLRDWTPRLGEADLVPGSSNGVPGGDPNVAANESFDLMWGRKFGTTSLGLRLNRTYFKTQDPTTNVVGQGNGGRNVMGFGGGLGFEMNPNTNVELGVLYSGRDFENTNTVTNDILENDSNTNWQVGGRMFWQWQPNVLVVPVAKFWSYDLGTKATAGGVTTTLDHTLSGWQIGTAGNWTVGSNDLFVLGLTFAQAKDDLTNNVVTTTATPLLFAGLETHAYNWLTLRFGANKGAWYKVKTEGPAGAETNVSVSPFNMSLGAGVKLGTLQLDTVFNPTFTQQLGSVFENNPNNSAFTKVTATYAF